jgi:hypothetical protein
MPSGTFVGIFAVVFTLGVIGFIVAAMILVFRFVSFVIRSVLGLDDARGRPEHAPLRRACPRPRCGLVNAPGSRYCARCGQSLADELDAYG